jgi:threonine synthase
MVQALQYGADLVKVDGTYDDAYDLSMAWCREKGGLSRNTAHNPMTIEGKKTVALEMYHQLGNRVPDHVFIPVGDGVIISGVYKGFRDLVTLGLAPKVPVLHGVQAEGSSALTRALENRGFTPAQPSRTLADSISVDVPRGGYYALKQLMDWGGKMITVTDQAIVDAQKELSTLSGLFVEPAAAASYAGFIKEKESLSPDESVVLLVTGSGLKDIETAKRGVAMP